MGESSAALEGEWVDSRQTSGHDVVVYTVESLLAQKLGISEGGGGGDECHFRAKAVWLQQGDAAYAKNNGLEIEHEPIEMLCILVVVSNPSSFRPSTHSYSRILWTEISNFLLSYEQKNVECVDPSLNSVELCIHGVCVATAYEYLTKNRAPRATPVIEASGSLTL